MRTAAPMSPALTTVTAAKTWALGSRDTRIRAQRVEVPVCSWQSPFPAETLRHPWLAVQLCPRSAVQCLRACF